jgi:hypothetical protein
LSSFESFNVGVFDLTQGFIRFRAGKPMQGVQFKQKSVVGCKDSSHLTLYKVLKCMKKHNKRIYKQKDAKKLEE